MKKFSIILLSLLTAFAMLLSGCGSKSAVVSDCYDWTTEEIAYDSAAAEEELYVNSDEITLSGYSSSAEVTAEAVSYERKIITNAGVNLDTVEFDSTLAALRETVETSGGYVASSSESGISYDEYGNPYMRSASMELKVPADGYESFIDGLKQYGNITYFNEYGNDITSDYYDCATRLEQYELQEDKLEEYLERAENISELMEIENALTEVRYEIESLQGKLNMWDELVAFATVNIDIYEVESLQPQRAEQAGFFAKMGDACSEAIEAMGSFLVWLAQAIIYTTPFALFFGIIAVIVLLIIRRAKKRRAGKAAVKVEQGQ